MTHMSMDLHETVIIPFFMHCRYHSLTHLVTNILVNFIVSDKAWILDRHQTITRRDAVLLQLTHWGDILQSCFTGIKLLIGLPYCSDQTLNYMGMSEQLQTTPNAPPRVIFIEIFCRLLKYDQDFCFIPLNYHTLGLLDVNMINLCKFVWFKIKY